MPECVLVPFGYFIVFSFASLIFFRYADIMEELKDLTPEQLKALIAMVKNA